MGLLGAVCDRVDLFSEFRHMSVVLQVAERERNVSSTNWHRSSARWTACGYLACLLLVTSRHASWGSASLPSGSTFRIACGYEAPAE